MRCERELEAALLLLADDAGGAGLADHEAELDLIGRVGLGRERDDGRGQNDWFHVFSSLMG